jgi:DNA polymerase III subunit alpha
MLDGASRIAEMFKAVADYDMPACAITDHGVMYGALEFYKAGGATGVKPILGMEGYLFGGDRHEKPPQRENSDKTYHLTLLAADNTGYHNLVKISSKAWLEGFHYYPRSDWEILSEFSEGVICLSGCLSAQIPRAIVSGDIELAKRYVGRYKELFGDRFYIELQDHGIPAQKPLNDELVRLAKQFGLNWVCTNDSHYTRKEDSVGHDALLCINTGSVLSDPDRFKFDSDEFYIKTPDEMASRFVPWPGACETTLEIAERCNVDITFGNLLFPIYDVPSGHTLESYLHERVFQGIAERYGQVTRETRERAEYELAVITKMGFAGYFLVVQDFVNWAKRNGIRVGPGRGSAAGSIVSYAIGITELDPLRYDLMFERFLNPERKAMPDIDIDFDDRRRGDVVRYVQDRYGSDHVAQIVTYGTIKGKQAIRDAARVLGHPYAEGDKLCKVYPPLIMGRDSGLSQALDSAPELRNFYDEGGAAKEIIDTALKVENLKRSAGIHAAGVVIGPDPLIEHLPLKRGDHGEIVTQYDMRLIEELGLLKMDFLGLRNLTVIQLTQESIKANSGVEVDVDTLDLADPKVYEMLCKGDSDGVFQLESDGMRRLLVQLRPDRFEQIMALIALYRPGPMEQIPAYIERKNDSSKITYLHETLEDITKETYGILVYQEQIVLMLQRLAGYTPGRADVVRKAIGKKNREMMAAEQPVFIEGCVRTGLSETEAKSLWALIQPFADYSFNRAHSACYAYVAYQTAWLKAHYPVEYMAALLTSVKDRKDDKPKYLQMARKRGIPVLIPDVNSSELDFTPVKDSIRFGLSAVRGVGEGVVTKIIEARRDKGDFTSFHDFCRKVDYACLNKKTVESLIKAGAFESLHTDERSHTRKGLLERFERVLAETISTRRQQDAGQNSLFGPADGNGASFVTDTPVSIAEFPKKTYLALEKEALGLYVSDHPLLGVEGLLSRMTDCTLASLGDRQAGEMLNVGGLVAGIRKRVTKNGSVMVLLDFEDVSGALVEVVVFQKAAEKFASLLRPDAILLIRGRVDFDVRDDSVKFIAMDVTEPNLEDRPVVINLSAGACTAGVVSQLKDVLSSHPGSTQVFLELAANQPRDDLGRTAEQKRTTVLRLGSEFWVDSSNGLAAELKVLLGPEALVSL